MSETRTLHVQYYAILREQAGRSTESLTTRAGTPAELYAELAARVRGTPDEEVFETLVTRPMWDLAHEYFESDVMRAHAVNAQDLGDPRAPGSALIYAYIRVNLRSAPETVGIVKGGMGAITGAMARAAAESGVTIRTGAEVARVDVQRRMLDLRLAGMQPRRERDEDDEPPSYGKTPRRVRRNGKRRR